MSFVWLSGRPAVGKLTVARHLCEQTGWRRFDNHVVVDPVLSLYDFGTPGFVALRDTLWRVALGQVLRDRAVDGVVFTFSAEATVGQPFVDDLAGLARVCGRPWLHVELWADEAVIEDRIAATSRQPTGKLTDLALYRRLRDAGTFDRPVLPAPDLRIDTGSVQPADAANRIAEALASRA